MILERSQAFIPIEFKLHLSLSCIVLLYAVVSVLGYALAEQILIWSALAVLVLQVTDGLLQLI